jgi:hypothetical protein
VEVCMVDTPPTVNNMKSVCENSLLRSELLESVVQVKWLFSVAPRRSVSKSRPNSSYIRKRVVLWGHTGLKNAPRNRQNSDTCDPRNPAKSVTYKVNLNPVLKLLSSP